MSLSQPSIPPLLREKCTALMQQSLIWGDMDAFQHLNNTVYFRFFEDIRMVYFEHVGVNQHKVSFNQGPILAHTECSFRLPLKYPGNIWIGTKAKLLSAKKMEMDYFVYSDEQDAIAAEGSGLVIFYDYHENKSCPIPEAIAEKIKASQMAGSVVL